MMESGSRADEALSGADGSISELRTRPLAQRTTRFRNLFDVHFAFVWRTLRRLGVPERLLPDASQRVFLIVSQRIDTIANNNERAFLFGTARRVAADFRRLDRNMAPIDGDAVVDDPLAPTLEELVDQKRARELLDRLLQAMPEDVRDVLILQEGEGMSLSEIAETIGIPIGTAASRLRRAREEFRRLLKQHMLSRPPTRGAR